MKYRQSSCRLNSSENDIRRKNAEFYIQGINNQNVILPAVPKNPMGHVWHIFRILVKKLEKLQNHPASKGIQTLIHYTILPHKQQAHAERNRLPYPMTKHIHSHNLSFPIHSDLSDTELTYGIDIVNARNKNRSLLREIKKQQK